MRKGETHIQLVIETRYVLELLKRGYEATGTTSACLSVGGGIAHRQRLFKWVVANADAGRPVTALMIARAVGCDARWVRTALERTQRKAYRTAVYPPPTQAAIFAAQIAMLRAGAPPDLFSSRLRRDKMPFSDQTWAQKRAEVWWLMRQPDPTTGRRLSYPEIAAATTGRSHSQIICGVRYHQAVLDARKASQPEAPGAGVCVAA